MSAPVGRIAITGASGFVGANLARRLLESGHEVHLLLRRDHRPWRLMGIESGAVVVHDADLRDNLSVKAAIAASRPDWVFHLAAYGAYPHQDDLTAAVATNVVGTANLLAAAAAQGVEAFIQAGSSSEYGFKTKPPGEDEVLVPASHYAATKAGATLLGQELRTTRNLPVVTLRLYSVYGPWEEPTRFIPALARAGLEGRLPPLASPETARDFVYVDDVCEAFILAAENAASASPVYNVGTGVQHRLRDVVEIARREFLLAEEPSWGSMADRAWDTSTWVADPSLIERELGWRAQTGLAEGFHQTVEWLRANPRLLDLYREMARPPARPPLER